VKDYVGTARFTINRSMAWMPDDDIQYIFTSKVRGRILVLDLVRVLIHGHAYE